MNDGSLKFSPGITICFTKYGPVREEDQMLDLRNNAVETPDDFRTLTNRAKEKGMNIQAVVITPRQHDDLLANSAAELGLFAGPIETFYGYCILQQEQD